MLSILRTGENPEKQLPGLEQKEITSKKFVNSQVITQIMFQIKCNVLWMKENILCSGLDEALEFMYKENALLFIILITEQDIKEALIKRKRNT